MPGKQSISENKTYWFEQAFSLRHGCKKPLFLYFVMAPQEFLYKNNKNECPLQLSYWIIFLFQKEEPEATEPASSAGGAATDAFGAGSEGGTADPALAGGDAGLPGIKEEDEPPADDVTQAAAASLPATDSDAPPPAADAPTSDAPQVWFQICCSLLFSILISRERKIFYSI